MKLMISHPCDKRRDWREFSRAEDGNTKKWRQDEYEKNASNSCIPIVDAIFRFINNFLADHFSVAKLLVFNPMTSASASSEETVLW